MKRIIAIVLIVWAFIFLAACKGKKKSFIPAIDIIKGQVNHIDTSLYQIIKVTYIDSNHNDTAYIKREDVRGLAKDFLEIPDLSKNRYSEENVPGPMDYQSTITYKAIHPEKEDVQRVELIIGPDPAATGNAQIQTIIIDRQLAGKDSAIEKRMLWRVDKSFQVTTTKQLPGEKEVFSSFKVIWNEDEKE